MAGGIRTIRFFSVMCKETVECLAVLTTAVTSITSREGIWNIYLTVGMANCFFFFVIASYDLSPYI